MSKAEKEVFKEELHCGGGCVWVGPRRLLGVLGSAAAAGCCSGFEPDTGLPDQTLLHQPIQVNTAAISSSSSSSSSSTYIHFVLSMNHS